MNGLCGIWGQPYIDLSEHIDTSGFDALDREIGLGLCEIEPSYTGGSLKWMGVVAPWVERDPYRDYGRVIRELSAADSAARRSASAATRGPASRTVAAADHWRATLSICMASVWMPRFSRSSALSWTSAKQLRLLASTTSVKRIAGDRALMGARVVPVI